VVAQSAADHVALGDREHAALNVSGALKHYEAAIAADPKNYAALTKAAHEATDLGEFDPSEQRRDTLYRQAEDYARRAVAANPGELDGHFELARAIGRRALTMGKRDQVKFASEVYNETQAALKINPNHAGAIHVMGVWNQHIMELNGLVRMLAKTVLGGKVFGEASWDNAQQDMEKAVALEPNRITHHLDLARVYEDRDQKAKAIEHYEWIARAPVTDFNDHHYKDEAARRLKELR
jgi:tetratricopeptide (TPR) repeat protein